MPTPTGQIALSDVNVELGNASNAQINMGNADVRGLAGVASGAITLNNLRGKSNVPTLLGSPSVQRGNSTSSTFNITLPTGTKSIIAVSVTLSNSSVNRRCTGINVAGNAMTFLLEHNYVNGSYRDNCEAYAINYTGSGTTSINATYTSSGGAGYGMGLMFACVDKELSSFTPSDTAAFNGNSGTINLYENGITIVGGVRGLNGTAFTNMTTNAERGADIYTDYWLGTVQPTSNTTNATISSNASDSIRNGTVAVSFEASKF